LIGKRFPNGEKPDLKRGKTGEKTTCEKTLFLQKLKALKRLLAGRKTPTITQP
jgi:hypothetical protein